MMKNCLFLGLCLNVVKSLKNGGLTSVSHEVSTGKVVTSANFVREVPA